MPDAQRALHETEPEKKIHLPADENFAWGQFENCALGARKIMRDFCAAHVTLM